MRRNVQKMKKAIKYEVSAGGVVFKILRDRFLIGFILDPYKKWVFAKGHVEKGETIRQAAIRETKEEMGLKNLRVKEPLGSMQFTFQFKGKKIRKTVYYFLMQTRFDEIGKPQKEEKIRAIKWMGLRTARKMLGYKNTLPIFERAYAILKRENKSETTKQSNYLNKSQ